MARNLLLLVALAALSLCWEWGCGPMGGHGGERAGFVVLATGNWQGHLEPCGCADAQLGGVHLRSHVLGKVAGESRLLLDTGPLVEGGDRQSELKLETFLLSLKRMGYDGIALTSEEIVTMHDVLGVEAEGRPVVVATDVGASVREEFGLAGHLEKTLESGGRRLGCLVLGVSGRGAMEREDLRERLALADPVEAVEAALAELGQAADESSEGRLVVVLMTGVDEEITSAVAGVKAVDVVLRPGISDEPILERPVAGGAAVVTTGELGKYVARLELGKSGAGEVEAFKTIAIRDDFPADRAVVAVLDQYQLRLEAEQLVETLPRLPLAEGAGFVGNKACKSCHGGIYEGWQGFGHAHAMATLIKVGRDKDPECVACHTVGMRYEGGYRSMEATPELADVGCEMCHGPAKGHVADREVRYEEVFTSCEDCHNSEHSPAFAGQREAYFERIRHWEGERRYWH